MHLPVRHVLHTSLECKRRRRYLSDIGTPCSTQRSQLDSPASTMPRFIDFRVTWNPIHMLSRKPRQRAASARLAVEAGKNDSVVALAHETLRIEHSSPTHSSPADPRPHITLRTWRKEEVEDEQKGKRIRRRFVGTAHVPSAGLVRASRPSESRRVSPDSHKDTIKLLNTPIMVRHGPCVT